MSSRIIFVRRRKNNSKIPDELYSEAKRKIGGKITTTGEPLKGLTPEEEIKWLPSLLATPVNDVGFRKKVNDFWYNIMIIVQQKDGTPLEIGMDATGEPISVGDYIKYRYLLKCPEVASDEKALKSDPTKKYFIYDPAASKIEDYDKMQVKKDSYKKFILITADEKGDDKIKHLFRMLTGKNPDIFDRRDMELALEKISMEDPKRFIQYADNKNLEVESLIAKAVSLEVVHKFGETYRYTDQLLGDSMDSTVAFLIDKKNSELMTTIKQKIKELDKLTKKVEVGAKPEKVETETV